MKVYLSADMEGVNGVVSRAETEPLAPEWDRSRRLMLGEVNAAIDGALKAGATEILVNDAHWTAKNLMLEDLHPAASLLSGYGKPYYMMAGIDCGFDAALFIGYHARAGSAAASVDHTFRGPDIVQGMWMNGVEMGEAGINGALAGSFGTPVALVSGDQTGCAQAVETLGDHVETVVVKLTLTRTAAIIQSPQRARQMICEATQRALARPHNLLVIPSPITLRIQFTRSSQADRAEFMPGARRVAARAIEFTDNDYPTVYQAMLALLVLGDVRD